MSGVDKTVAASRNSARIQALIDFIHVRSRGCWIALFVFGIEDPVAARVDLAAHAPGFGTVAAFAAFDFSVTAVRGESAVIASVGMLFVDVVQVRGHIIAFFVAADNTIAAYGVTRALPHADKAVERHFVVGTAAAALGMEHIDGINTAGIHVQFAGRHSLFERNVLAPGAVNAADIDAQTAVKEDPDVIIACKCQGFAATIFKVGLEMRSKLAIDAVVGRTGRPIAIGIDWPEIIALIMIFRRANLFESHGFVDAAIDTGNILVPPLKDLGAGVKQLAGDVGAVVIAACSLNGIEIAKIRRSIRAQLGQNGILAFNPGAVRIEVGAGMTNGENEGSIVAGRRRGIAIRGPRAARFAVIRHRIVECLRDIAVGRVASFAKLRVMFVFRANANRRFRCARIRNVVTTRARRASSAGMDRGFMYRVARERRVSVAFVQTSK